MSYQETKIKIIKELGNLSREAAQASKSTRIKKEKVELLQISAYLKHFSEAIIQDKQHTLFPPDAVAKIMTSD